MQSCSSGACIVYFELVFQNSYSQVFHVTVTLKNFHKENFDTESVFKSLNVSFSMLKFFLLRIISKQLVLDNGIMCFNLLNPLSANPTKWSNTLKPFVGNLPTTCLSVFDHFVGLAPKG